MVKVVDILSVGLLLAAVVSFALGLRALGHEKDLVALYWLVVGALSLRSATQLLRPHGAR